MKTFFKKNKIKIILLLIFSLAFVLRFWRLSENPPALNWDEVSHGYNAYSILKTGRDEWGKFLPWANFRAYGDYPLPANLYLTIPSIYFFGLNEFGIRFPHALLGALTVFSCFFLVCGLGFSFGTSLISALLVAISPWTLFPSRFVVQSNVSLFFITVGLALFFNRKKKSIFLPLSALSLGISVYSYHNARIFIPLLIISLIFLYRKEGKKWWEKEKVFSVATAAVLLLFFLPLIPVLLGPEGKARARWVSIIDQGAVNQIIDSRLNSKLPSSLARLIYNRPAYFLSHFFLNYSSYFSPKFLFFEGGTQYQFNIPKRGVLYLVEIPFFYSGFGLLIFWALIKKKRFAQAMLLWFFLAPIPAAITKGTGHVIRATTILPLPQIFSALGVSWLGQFLKKKIKKADIIITAGFILIIFISAFSYFKEYFGSYRIEYSWSWQYGYKEVAGFIKNHYQEYSKIFITKKYGEPHEFLLFYLKWDPKKYRTDSNLVRYFRSDWYWVDSFDKFVFINDWEIKKRVREEENKKGNEEKYLLVTSPENYPEGWNIIETINFLDGRSAFEIREFDTFNH